MSNRRKQRNMTKRNKISNNSDISSSFNKIEETLSKEKKTSFEKKGNVKIVSFAFIAIISITAIISFSNVNLFGQSNFTTAEGEPQVFPTDMPSRYDDTLTIDPKLSSAYQYATDHPEILSQLICHCGCNNIMHQPYHENNKQCFWSVDEDYEPHAETCSTCVYIALTAKSLVEANWTTYNIRSFIDSQY